MATTTISIHAPAKGATSAMSSFWTLETNFNPRTREGCDCFRCQWSIPLWRNFNPRTREGCDVIFCKSFWTILISIHAPAKGATRVPSGSCVVFHISIHAPAKGATNYYEGFDEIRLFQSTHPRRVRLK